MGQMGDRRSHVIVFPVRQGERNRAHALNQRPVCLHLFGRNLLGGGQDIVGVL